MPAWQVSFTVPSVSMNTSMNHSVYMPSLPLVEWWSLHIVDFLVSHHVTRWSPGHRQCIWEVFHPLPEKKTFLIVVFWYSTWSSPHVTGSRRTLTWQTLAYLGKSHCWWRTLNTDMECHGMALQFCIPYQKWYKMVTCSCVNCEFHFVLLWQGIRYINLWGCEILGIIVETYNN